MCIYVYTCDMYMCTDVCMCLCAIKQCAVLPNAHTRSLFLSLSLSLAYMYTYIHMCVWVSVRVCVYVCTHIYVYMIWWYTYICIYVCTYVHIYIYTYILVRIYIVNWRLLLLLLVKKYCSGFVCNSQGAVFYTHRSERLWFADCRHIFYFSKKKRHFRSKKQFAQIIKTRSTEYI